MPTANEALFDALVRHQIGLMRLSSSVRNDINRVLNATEDDLRDAINRRLSNADGGRGETETRRLQTLLNIVKNIRLEAWDQLDTEWLEAMYDITVAEGGSFVKTLNTVSPAVLDTVLPAVSKLKAIVDTDLFEGRTFKEWIAKVKQDDLVRMGGAIRQGMIQGESSQQIAGRVLGTAAFGQTDGVTEMTRRNAEAITRTAINNFANEARTLVALENKDIIPAEIFVATLDNRTTPVCRANDGKRFAVGVGPKPPLHFNCRSLRVPLLSPEAIGNRPAKAGTERMMLREFAAKNKIDVVTSRDDLPHGMKGKFDDFSRARMRELTGQVPAKTTYQEWLGGQSREFQNDVLGETRARLFRDGKLKLDRFVNRNGDELTLSELARRERQAFIDAGLDPDEF